MKRSPLTHPSPPVADALPEGLPALALGPHTPVEAPLEAPPAPLAWDELRVAQIRLPPEVLDLDHPLRPLIRQAVLGVPAPPHVIDVGFVPVARGLAVLRIYLDHRAEATPEWFEAVRVAVAAVLR